MISKVVSINQLDLTDEERQRLLNGDAMFVYKDDDGKYKPYAPIEAAQMPFGIALSASVEGADGRREVTIVRKGWVENITPPDEPYYCKPGDPPAEPKIK